MDFILVAMTGRVHRTRWLTEAHFRAADRGDVVLVAIPSYHVYRHGQWRPIAPRRGEPLVMLVSKDADEED